VSDAHTPLGPGAEFDRIRTIWQRLGARAAPSGDDCSFIDVGGHQLAVSTDMAVERVHFHGHWLEPEELGWHIAAAALSDLAAVAGAPLGLMASIGAPGDRSADELAALMEGVASAGASVGATVRGGDLVRSDRLVVDLVVFGTVDRPLLRSGAAPGDGLWVTGALGAPAAAVRSWLAGRQPSEAARDRFARPVPRVAEAKWLSDAGATALIDLSDGLVPDAGHLAAASRVACRIDAEWVPVHRGAGGRDDALAGGEEYELLCAMPAGFDSDGARPFAERFGAALTQVGIVEAGEGVRLLDRGHSLALPTGYLHFEE
jgi:thiamine-monophosphate kinase